MEKLGSIMRGVFSSASGPEFKKHLETVAMTLSAVTADGAVNEQRATDVNEGQRLLAVTLLGAGASQEEGGNEP